METGGRMFSLFLAGLRIIFGSPPADVAAERNSLVTEFAPRRIRALDRVLAQQTQKEQTKKEQTEKEQTKKEQTEKQQTEKEQTEREKTNSKQKKNFAIPLKLPEPCRQLSMGDQKGRHLPLARETIPTAGAPRSPEPARPVDNCQPTSPFFLLRIAERETPHGPRPRRPPNPNYGLRCVSIATIHLPMSSCVLQNWQFLPYKE